MNKTGRKNVCALLFVCACLVGLALARPAHAVQIILQPGPAEGKDSRVYSGGTSGPTTNYGTSDSMQVRSKYNQRRSFIEFDLSSIPSGATITGADLELFRYGCDFVPGGDPPYGDGQTDVNAYRVTQAWTEGTGGTVPDPGPYDPTSPLTWLNQPAYDSTVIDTALCTKAEGPVWKTWDVTGLVSDWHGGVYPNHGFALNSVDDGDWAYFYSSDYTGNEALRPRLVVEYIPEPSTLVLGLLGTGFVGVMARRRRLSGKPTDP